MVLYWSALYWKVFLTFCLSHVCEWGGQIIRNSSKYDAVQINTYAKLVTFISKKFLWNSSLLSWTGEISIFFYSNLIYIPEMQSKMQY